MTKKKNKRSRKNIKPNTEGIRPYDIRSKTLIHGLRQPQLRFNIAFQVGRCCSKAGEHGRHTAGGMSSAAPPFLDSAARCPSADRGARSRTLPPPRRDPSPSAAVPPPCCSAENITTPVAVQLRASTDGTELRTCHETGIRLLCAFTPSYHIKLVRTPRPVVYSNDI